MNKILVILGLAILMEGCAGHSTAAPASAPLSVVKDISDLKEIAKIVPAEPGRVLYVFDIDDTLLTSHHAFGSDYWFGWQFDSRNASPVPCVLDVSAITTEEKSLMPTQPDAPAVFNAIAGDKLLLTARDADTARGATRRELRVNNYVLPHPLGHEDRGYIFVLKDQNRSASYANGVYMVTGQDKGKALLYLLDEILDVPQKYHTVVLVDDGQGNIDKMQAAVGSAGMHYYGLHYIKIDKPKEVPAAVREAWQEAWERFIEGLAAVSQARANKIMASQCAYR